MRALRYDHFGDIDVLTLTDADAPDPGPGEVRVRVVAASINPLDGKIRRGELTLLSGKHFPKTVGQDLAGVVDALGAGVTGLAVGDAVFGAVPSMKEGSMADLVVVPAGSIARKPRTLGFDASAAAALVAQAADTALVDVARVGPGTRVLVNGCTGGVGVLAVQLAKRLGAHVTGVCGTDGVALARELGCDVVVDYRSGSVADAALRFDAILELSGKLPHASAESLLEAHGVYVDFSPTPLGLVTDTVANVFRAHPHRYVLTKSTTGRLEALAAAFDAGHLRPPPIALMSLADARRAFALAEGGGVLGKVVLELDPPAGRGGVA